MIHRYISPRGSIKEMFVPRWFDIICASGLCWSVIICCLIYTFLAQKVLAFDDGDVDLSTRPERVILLYMDGLHPKTIDHFKMTAIQDLRDNGTYAQIGLMSFPTHPTILPYGDYHFTSAPNVMTMTGSMFLEPRPRYLHQQFTRMGKTLHAAGSRSYRSLNIGFDYAFTTGGATDAELIDFYIEAFEREGDIVFARIMLQELGNAGRKGSGKNLSNDPWAQNIFHPDGPYAAAAQNANLQIERLRSYLRGKSKHDSTLFVIMGDGQSPHGWHLTLDPESAMTPIIFSGAGIAVGKTIPYAENIDIAPTIAAMMNVGSPNSNGGSGRVLTNVMIEGAELQHPRFVEQINEQIRRYYRLHAEATLRAFDDPKLNLLLMELDHHLLSKHQFFTVERLMEWHEAGDLESMATANEWVLETLRLALEDGVYRFGEF